MTAASWVTERGCDIQGASGASAKGWQGVQGRVALAEEMTDANQRLHFTSLRAENEAQRSRQIYNG